MLQSIDNFSQLCNICDGNEKKEKEVILKKNWVIYFTVFISFASSNYTNVFARNCLNIVVVWWLHVFWSNDLFIRAFGGRASKRLGRVVKVIFGHNYIVSFLDELIIMRLEVHI